MIQALLFVAGAGLLVLALAHIAFPSRLGWTADMRLVKPLTREVFFVHVFSLRSPWS